MYYDALIIGNGIAGSSAALFLAENLNEFYWSVRDNRLRKLTPKKPREGLYIEAKMILGRFSSKIFLMLLMEVP